LFALGGTYREMWELQRKEREQALAESPAALAGGDGD
jgi:hypothetical protein